MSASLLALHAVEKFTMFCARRVIVTRAPSVLRSSERALEFGYYGIGLCLQHPDGAVETLVEPRPWRAQRHTPTAWWFAETAYGQFLTQQSSPYAPTPPL